MCTADRREKQRIWLGRYFSFNSGIETHNRIRSTKEEWESGRVGERETFSTPALPLSLTLSPLLHYLIHSLSPLSHSPTLPLSHSLHSLPLSPLPPTLPISHSPTLLQFTVLDRRAHSPKPECRRRIRGRSAEVPVQQTVQVPPTLTQIPAGQASAFFRVRVTAAVPGFPASYIPGHK